MDCKNKPIKKSFIRFEQLEWYDNDIPRYDLLSRILENEEEAKNNTKEAGYDYFKKKTKRSLLSYFLQNYDLFKEFISEYCLENFQSDN